MEGDRNITLRQPGPELRRDSYGEVIRGPDIQHQAWGERLDRGGREREEAETVIGEHYTIFRVRLKPSIALVNTTWYLEDEDFTEWDIEVVNEQEKPRKRWLRIYCTARAPANKFYIWVGGGRLLVSGVPLTGRN